MIQPPLKSVHVIARSEAKAERRGNPKNVSFLII